MSTPYSEIYNLFLDKIKSDSNFFILNPDGTVNEQLTDERKKKLLNRAVPLIKFINDKKNFEIDLNDKDNELSILNYDATDMELELMASYMYQCYIDEFGVERIHALSEAGFSDSEIKIVLHSPANSLKEFMAKYESLKLENVDKTKMYLRRGRLDNKYKLYNWNF